ncbi:MAG: VWA domain-containing protein [Gloeobacteraceae cyanobacterium ES-bin-144]|nr:VWA domain-containing protein [Verrucomicrobiales bacterium]
MNFFPSFILNFLATSQAKPEWNVSFEGLTPGWAFLLFLALALATVFAYWKFASAASTVRKGLMIFLRIAAALVLVTLLAKPVINLTVQNPVRQPLLVLLDGSESMKFKDRRDRTDDLKRAAIAAGEIENIGQNVSPDVKKQLSGISRQTLLEKLAANPKLDLWPRLEKQADLMFYQFGRSANRLPFSTEGPIQSKEVAEFFKGLNYTETATSLGESLRQVLQEPRPQPAGGVLLITDGANNSGSSPIEAAQIAKEQGVPLFIFGVGVTSPRDVRVREVTTQKLAFVNETLEVRAQVLSLGMDEGKVTALLESNGETLAEREVSIGGDSEQEVVFQFSPKTAGEIKLQVVIPLQGEEASKENNIGKVSVRVTDKKFRVLLIEQEPRWDFRYLLDYLQRDPRLEVKCVMINGEPGLDQFLQSPFLPGLPQTREEFFKSQVIILGDVSPSDLGIERMQTIAEWVEAGGGLIFQAGSNFNPRSYAGTPLEALLPIVPDTTSSKDSSAQRTPEPFPLQLSKSGETSLYLQMDPDPAENKRIWEAFQGVCWTAPVSRVKAGAEVLLVDPRPERSGRYGMQPVFAMQGYGAGKCVYFGTDETYRWRSRTGGKYYSILWGQIMQSLSLQLLEGASALTQLKSDRKQYAIGDNVVISGNAYTEGYEPLIIPTLDGTMKFEGNGKRDEQPFELHATEKNNFRSEFVARLAGNYRYTTTHDSEAVVQFEVIDPRLEQSQSALDEKLLKSMAEASGGRFFREENLAELPAMIAAKTATVASTTKLELFYSGWLLAALISFLSLEWMVRRLTQLK